jgi:hypothetical protein
VYASSPTQIINLLLSAALAPVAIWTVRKLTHPGRWWMLYGFLGIAASGVLTVAQNLVPFPLIWYVKDSCYAFAGVAYAIGLWQVNVAIRRRVIL